MVIEPHHFPTDFTEKMYTLLRTQGETLAPALAEQMQVSEQTIVSACMHDKRLMHCFKADQKYWISARDYDNEND